MKKLFGAFLILVLVASGFANVQPIKAQALELLSIQYSNTHAVEASYNQSFRIDDNSVLWACGYNYGGQLGDGTTTDQSTPIKVMEDVVSVSAGGNHTLAIKTGGNLWAWGSNWHGVLGDGTTKSILTPIKVMEDVVSISAGGYHSLAIKIDGSLWAWGDNTYGQLGDGTTTYSLIPIKIMENVVSVSAGGDFTLAIKTDGSLWAWGANYQGQLGDQAWFSDGTWLGRSHPVKVMENVVNVSAGNEHTVVIKADASLWGMGYGISSESPIKLMEDVISVSAGGYYTLAIKTGGSLWAWGANSSGQLGDGTTTDRINPFKVIDNVVSVSAGYGHTLAVKTDGSLWVWGANYVGQLGDGTFTNRLTPLKLITAKPVMSIPTNLSATYPNATGVKLSWTSVSGANGYQIYRSNSSTGTYSWIANAWTNSYTNTGLTTGTTYYYKVSAMDTTKSPTVTSGFSGVISAKPVAPLGIPLNLSATYPSSTSVKLSWTSVSGANGYQIYRSNSSTGTYSWIANAWTNSYTNTGLTTGTTYYYKVSAMDTTQSPTVTSGFSGVISAKPVAPLGIPLNLSATYPSSTSVKLSWTSVSGANGYQIYRSNSSTGTYSWIANAWTNSYTNTGLTTGTTYYYKVSAMDTTKSPTVTSGFSGVISAKPVAPLGIPTNLSVTYPNATSVKLSWTSVSGANGYQIYRSNSSTGTYSWIANAWTNSYTNTSLTTGTTYYYKINAMNSGTSPTTYSAYSNYVNCLAGS